jgi:hypothetical protein
LIAAMGLDFGGSPSGAGDERVAIDDDRATMEMAGSIDGGTM